MRVLFFGTPDFAVPTLDALLNAGHEIVLVVAQPDKPAGRGHTCHSPPVIERARSLHLPIAQPVKIKTGEFPEQIEALNADVAVVIAYGRILTPRLLAAPRRGCINVHASLLPRWRGAAPIQWSIWAGDTVTGVCTQQMEEGLDTGPVYVELQTRIGPHETASDLHDRLAILGAEAAILTLRDWPTPTPQAPGGVTYASKIDKEMGVIDWNQPAINLDRQVRAMTAWPGGVAQRGTEAIKLIQVQPAPNATHTAPGTVISTRPLVITCGEGALELVRVQAPGRKPISGSEYANGAHLAVGQRWQETR